jgi:hypothetical protein
LRRSLLSGAHAGAGEWSLEDEVQVGQADELRDRLEAAK